MSSVQREDGFIAQDVDTKKDFNLMIKGGRE